METQPSNGLFENLQFIHDLGKPINSVMLKIKTLMLEPRVTFRLQAYAFLDL